MQACSLSSEGQLSPRLRGTADLYGGAGWTHLVTALDPPRVHHHFTHYRQAGT